MRPGNSQLEYMELLRAIVRNLKAIELPAKKTELSADSLLEIIRQTGDADERESSLQELRDVIKEDVPAVFLYSPIYTFAYHQDLQGIKLGDLSLHSDRFLTLHNWYIQEHRIFKAGRGWGSFFGWMFSLVF